MEDKDKEQYFQGNPDIPMRETEYTEERNELALRRHKELSSAV